MTAPVAVRRAVRWPLERQRWAWAVPLVVFVVARREMVHLSKLLGLLVALVVLSAVVRRPARALSALIVLLPLNTVLLALVYRLGAPAALVRPLGYWKEGVIAGLAMAAVGAWRVRRPRLDLLDKLCLAYVMLGLAYVIAPALIIGHAPGDAVGLFDRFRGWRTDVLYIGLLPLVRHLGLERPVVERAARRLVVVGLIAALAGLVEFFSPGTWNHLAVHTLGVQRYRNVVLGEQPSPSFQLNTVLVYGSLGGHHVRIGSILFDYLNIGYLFTICLAVATDLVARGRAAGWVYIALPALAAALLLTQSRSAIIAGGVVIVVALRRQVGRTLTNRVRFALLLAVGAVVAVPLVLSTGALSRFGGDQRSDSTHSGALRLGIHAMAVYPLGRGLSTAAGSGQTTTNTQVATIPTQETVHSADIVTENQYLQIGTQLGDLGLVLFTGVEILLIVRLARRHPQPDDGDETVTASSLPPALLAAGIGVAVAGLFIQTFTRPETTYLFWALAGAAVGADDGDRMRAAQLDIHRVGPDPTLAPLTGGNV